MRLFPIAAALTLAACGTAQSPQYFVLPDSQYIRPAAQGSEIAVKVNLAEPLANGGLVYQTDAYHVNLAKNHLWAAPLDGALAANLSNKLNRLNPRHTFVPASRSQSGQTLKELRQTLQGVSPQSPIYGDVQNTLQSLDKTLRDVQPVINTLKEKPNALIFNSSSKDPIPKGSR